MERKVRTLSTVEFLQTVDSGGCLEDLKEAINEAAQAVNDRGGAGKVTLELNFKKLGRRQLTVTDKVKVTIPPKKKDETVVFVGDHGLTRENPDQLRIEEVSQ